MFQTTKKSFNNGVVPAGTNITRPDLVRTHWVEVLIQQVIGYAVAVFALGSYFVSHPLRDTQTQSTHQPANSVSTNFKAFRAKCLHHFPTAQTGSARLKQCFDPAAKPQLLSINQLARAFAPVVVSRLADLHNPAQNGDRVVGRFDLDETKSYFISFAKKAEVFFNISGSINRLRFSLRNLMSSSRSGSASARPPRLASYFSFHRYISPGVIPRDLAASGTEYHCSLTRATASSLNWSG